MNIKAISLHSWQTTYINLLETTHYQILSEHLRKQSKHFITQKKKKFQKFKIKCDDVCLSLDKRKWCKMKGQNDFCIDCAIYSLHMGRLFVFLLSSLLAPHWMKLYRRYRTFASIFIYDIFLLNLNCFFKSVSSKINSNAWIYTITL